MKRTTSIFMHASINIKVKGLLVAAGEVCVFVVNERCVLGLAELKPTSQSG